MSYDNAKTSYPCSFGKEGDDSSANCAPGGNKRRSHAKRRAKRDADRAEFRAKSDADHPPER
jgi:hypothetical protein